MQPIELKAVLAKTNEVAIKPVHVEINVANIRNRYGNLHCPIGLVRAKVIQDGYPWTERRTIAQCGDQDYEIKRKNGVLVEIDPDDLPDTALDIEWVKHRAPGSDPHKKVNSNRFKYKHATVVKRGDGKQVIHLITSRKAIFSSWGEYELEQAKRDKERAEQDALNDALLNPQAALMGMTREEFGKTFYGQGNRSVYLGSDYFEVIKRDSNGHMVYEDNRPVFASRVGKIEITVDQANKILSMLTDEQKEMLKVKS
jgi:hypothetical protein